MNPGRSDNDLSDSGAALHFAQEHSLRPWHEVARLWNQKSGQRITRNRVWQICKRAERKLRLQLAQFMLDLDEQRGGRA